MSDWAENAGSGSAVPTPQVDAGDAEAPAEKVDTGDTAAIRSQLDSMKNDMQAMRQMHQQQLSGIYSSMQAHAAPAVAPELPPMPAIPGIEKDDPYYDQLAHIAQSSSSDTADLRNQVGALQEQLNNMNMSMSRQSVQTQIDSSFDKHAVPQSMAQDIRNVVYAAMATAPPGQMPAADAIVGRFMQGLGVFREDAIKQHAVEASKPRPLSVVAKTAGIPDEAPKTMEEAKERSLAMMKAMVGVG